MYFISHVGGHKFAANVMIYRRADDVVGDGVEANGHGRNGHEINGNHNHTDATIMPTGKKSNEEQLGEASQCIWLARVRPEDCEGIIKQTVLKGKIVKPERQLRGGFDRGRRLVSW